MFTRSLMLAAAAVALAGCGSNQQVVRDCCYQGVTVESRLGDLPLTLRDGGRTTVGSALIGFRPWSGVGGPRYPLREVNLSFVTEDDMEAVFTSYDANRDGFLEQPELNVLYVNEAAMGLGVPVAYVGDGTAVGAVDTAPADIMGLVQFVRDNKGRMAPRARKVFAAMEELGSFMRGLNPTGGDGVFLHP